MILCGVTILGLGLVIQVSTRKHHLQPATKAITVKWRHVTVNGRNMFYVAINMLCEAHSVQLVPRPPTHPVNVLIATTRHAAYSELLIVYPLL